ncbi:glutamic acid-rich protein-like [Anopheles nili]|uniref:glutamic acid-rich protein-like n=1 Tax=Anopheles nili TaxID=185578 RepID=UPI00237A4309|nr:glutamic acid-rich protein-like [Anopheles nili]
MCRVELFVLAVAIVVECTGLHMYPEIFETSRFLRRRPLALKSVSPRSDDDQHSDGGFKDGEVGFVRSSSESGTGGFRHRENFHKKDGNKFGHERQTGFGESKRAGDELGADHGKLVVDTHHYRPEPMYEVTEEQSDIDNPDKHKKYGMASSMGSKPVKKPTTGKRTTVVSKSSSKPAKGKSQQTKDHSGFESIVYHENERDSSEHGYGVKKTVGKLPKQADQRKPAKQVAHDELDDESEDRDIGLESDDEYDGEAESDSGRESDFADNYDAVRFDVDFERSFGSGETGEDEGTGGDGRTAGRKNQEQDYDYDAEVDRDEVDESANEDKYRGDEDDDEDGEHEEAEKGGDDRQYEYASEADGDATDDY